MRTSMVRAQTIRLQGIATLCAGLLIAGNGWAAEWSVAPFLSVGGDFDDNAGLASRTDEEDEISGVIARLSADIGYRSEISRFTVTPRFTSRRYPGDSDRDSDDQSTSFGYQRQMENGEWALLGNFQRDYIRTGERGEVDFDAEDPEDIPDDDSGRVGARVRRTKWGLAPRMRVRLSERSFASFRARHTDVDYDETLETRLVDYYTTVASGRYHRQLSERNTGLLEATARWYHADEVDNDSSSFGMMAGFRRDLTETTSFETLGGVESSEQADGGNTSNFVGEANLVHRLETIRLLAQYRRSISGTGSGTLTRRDQVNLAITRRLSDLLSAGIGVLGYQTTSVEDDVDFDERTYVQLRAQFGWRLSRTINIEANYRYTMIDREDENESANSNALTVWFNYRPNPITRSR